MNREASVLELRRISCARPNARLHDVSLTFAPRTINLLLGDADSAHLLLRLAGLQEAPDSGEIAIDDRVVPMNSDEECEALRGRKFGFVYSAPYVLPGLSVLENVAMPLLRTAGMDTTAAAHRAAAVIAFAGLTDCMSRDAGELSRLDQHRLALARALAHEPHFLILDRAEAGLLPGEATAFRQLVEQASADAGVTVIATIATVPYAGRADRMLGVEDGSISELQFPANS